MNRNKLRIALVGVATTAVISVAGFAFAAFIETTPTDASGGVGDLIALTVVPGSTVIDYANDETKLWPGPNHKASVTFTVTNENEIDVKITGVTLASASLTGSGCGSDLKIAGAVAATASDVVLPAGSFTGGDLVVHKNNAEELEVTLEDIIELDAAAAHACENVQFTAHFSVTGTGQ